MYKQIIHLTLEENKINCRIYSSINKQNCRYVKDKF